jgi:hypothetical protein
VMLTDSKKSRSGKLRSPGTYAVSPSQQGFEPPMSRSRALTMIRKRDPQTYFAPSFEDGSEVSSSQSANLDSVCEDQHPPPPAPPPPCSPPSAPLKPFTRSCTSSAESSSSQTGGSSSQNFEPLRESPTRSAVSRVVSVEVLDELDRAIRHRKRAHSLSEGPLPTQERERHPSNPLPETTWEDLSPAGPIKRRRRSNSKVDDVDSPEPVAQQIEGMVARHVALERIKA